MKIVVMKRYIFAFMVFALLSSCDKKDDAELTPESLDGRWELQSVSCFCFFEDDFNFGQHKLEFDQANSTLKVENSDEIVFVTGPGTYNIKFTDNKFSIKNTLEYIFEITGSTLTLTFVDDPAIADDEISLKYQKLE